MVTLHKEKILQKVSGLIRNVDRHRIKEVGPNLACAEWLLKNGASVRFKGNVDLVSDYNKLIGLEDLSESPHFRIDEVYAKEVHLTSEGFEYFKNCNEIRKITFISCPLTDETLVKLAFVKNSLQCLEIRSCPGITDSGILSLTQLGNLQVLTLANLIFVEKKDECKGALRKALPKCQIDFH